MKHKNIIDIVFLAEQEVQLLSQIDILQQLQKQITFRIKGLKEDLEKNIELSKRNYEEAKSIIQQKRS